MTVFFAGYLIGMIALVILLSGLRLFYRNHPFITKSPFLDCIIAGIFWPWTIWIAYKGFRKNKADEHEANRGI